MEEIEFSEKTEKLWQWFVRSEKQIKTVIESGLNSEQLVKDLNELVLDFGPLSWDIGKNTDDNWFFTISPNGDENRLILTEAIIEEAPTFLNWIFQDSKPAVKWDGKLSTFDESFNEIEIDTSNWNYIAYQYSETQLEIVFEIGDAELLSKNQKEDLIYDFLNKQLGEKIKILAIAKCETVSNFDEEDAEDKNGVAELQQHLLDFIA